MILVFIDISFSHFASQLVVETFAAICIKFVEQVTNRLESSPVTNKVHPLILIH